MTLFSGVNGVYYECMACGRQVSGMMAQRRAQELAVDMQDTISEVDRALAESRRVQTSPRVRRGGMGKREGWYKWYPIGGQRDIDILYAFAMALGFLDDTTQRGFLLEMD